jgi:energy-coupling factor transporter transmembrane protein EcfT
MIKLLLMTTLYENILYLFFKYLDKKTGEIYQHLFYEVNIAIEFIEAIFQYLELIKNSYIIRFLNFNKNMPFIEHLIIYFFCIKQLIINIQKQIYIVAESLYSREIY